MPASETRRPAPAGNERFLIHSPAEIARVLRRLMQQRALISAHIDGGRTLLTTAVVLVDAQRDLVALDQSHDPLINQRVMAASKLFCVSKLETVEVKFTLSGISDARLQGEPVFRTHLPPTIFYPQQREYFRLSLPRTAPLHCKVLVEEGCWIDLRVVDISVGGLGVVDYAGDAPLRSGVIYPQCRVALPGMGEVIFDLEVRSVFEVTMQRGDPVKRAGCAFHNLSHAHAALVQRYINQQQVELRRTTPD